MSRPDLLFLTQRLPYPPTKGEKIRPFQILRHVSESFTVHLGCLIDDPADRAHVAALRPFCRDIHVSEIDRRRATVLCLRGLLTGEPLSVTFFKTAALAAWVRRVMEQVRPAATFVCSSNMAPYVLDLPATGLRIVDLADVDSEKWRAYADTAHGPMRFVYRREWRKVAALERRIARECDHATFVSGAEAALMTTLVPDSAARIHGISSGVDYRFFDPGGDYETPYPDAGPVFVFTGTMDYRPNVDAVRWFTAEVLPLIRASLPAAQFCVVGNRPAPAVRALAEQPGVTVTGWVADVRPYLAHAAVAVAPMRIARGIQNKVLEGMAMGRPVVVTAGALEGIDAEPGRDLLQADDPADFAAACVRLTEPEGAVIGAAARRQVEAHYDWAVQLRAFDALLSPALTHAAVPGACRTMTAAPSRMTG